MFDAARRIFRPHRYVLIADKEKATTERHDAAQDTKSSYHRTLSRAVLVALLLSLTLNLSLVVECLRLLDKGATTLGSRYAHLTADVAVAWTHKSPYTDKDSATTDQLWEDIRIDDGIVALSDSYVMSMGLPISQRFLLDENKGIYILNGFHSMHCLKVIRQHVVEFDRGLNLSEPAEHILHCVDALRQDVLCYADDELRYTGSQPVGRSGTGQSRQCRSWSQLDAWAQENTACYRYLDPHNHTLNPLAWFQSCPDGSPYGEKAKLLLGGL